MINKLSGIVLFVFSLAISACGQEADEPSSAPEIQVGFLDSRGRELKPLDADKPVLLPTTLVLTLVGPDGSRTETIDFAKRKIALGELRKGTWSIRGDGLDDLGNLRWQAAPTTFIIRPDKTTSVELTFQELEQNN